MKRSAWLYPNDGGWDGEFYMCVGKTKKFFGVLDQWKPIEVVFSDEPPGTYTYESSKAAYRCYAVLDGRWRVITDPSLDNWLDEHFGPQPRKLYMSIYQER